MSDVEIWTEWRKEEGILATRVAGVLRKEDVERWSEGLKGEGASIEPGTPFRMLVDIRGYEVAEQDREVHQAQRVVIPNFLAVHGFVVGFFRLFEAEPEVEADPSKGRCVAVAHVHHDCGKMENYNAQLGRDEERFFCDVGEARAWLSRPSGSTS